MLKYLQVNLKLNIYTNKLGYFFKLLLTIMEIVFSLLGSLRLSFSLTLTLSLSVCCSLQQTISS